MPSPHWTTPAERHAWTSHSDSLRTKATFAPSKQFNIFTTMQKPRQTSQPAIICMQLSPGLKESRGELLCFCVRWVPVFMLITCIRVMMFGLMLDDTEWINNEPGQSWTTWLFIFSKIWLNFTAMSWQPSAKRKLSATAGPNQFQLALDTRCYRLFYFSLLHQIQLYQHPFQIHSVNMLFKIQGFINRQSFSLEWVFVCWVDVVTEGWSVFL